jgi:hypothetical protein
MTAAQFEELDAPQAEEVLRGRFEVLVGAGYDPGNALLLASHVEVELGLAVDLVTRGCPPSTALRIVL